MCQLVRMEVGGRNQKGAARKRIRTVEVGQSGGGVDKFIHENLITMFLLFFYLGVGPRMHRNLYPTSRI